MSKSRKDKRVRTPSGAELDSDSFSQHSSYPPRIFSNMAASTPLSPQGGNESSSNLDGCTRVPPAIDEEGGGSRLTVTPSISGAKGTSIPDRAPINLEVPEADLNIALKFLEFMKSNSGAATPFVRPAPAALGAPPREASASAITTGLVTRPGIRNSWPLGGGLQAPSTPCVAFTRGCPDQMGPVRDPRSLPPYGVPEPLSRLNNLSGLASGPGGSTASHLGPELFGHASVPPTVLLPSNYGTNSRRGIVPHGSPPELSAPLPFGTDTPLIWDAPSVRVDSDSLSVDPSFDYEGEDAYGEEVFSPDWDQMGQEAEVILQRYLGSAYKAGQTPGEAASASTEDTLGPLFSFSGKRNVGRGISLPKIFQDRFDEVASENPKTSKASDQGKAFRFVPVSTEQFFQSESLSDDLLALGASMANPNPLLHPLFKKEDARWRAVSSLARTSLRLAAYSTALLDILTRAEELQVSEEDRSNIGTILITISELSFAQAARSSVLATRQRRKLALSTLGLDRQADSTFIHALPVRGPSLFNDRILDAVDKEIGINKRASEVATKLRPLVVSRSSHPSRPFSRPFGSSRFQRRFRTPRFAPRGGAPRGGSGPSPFPRPSRGFSDRSRAAGPRGRGRALRY